MHHSEVVNLTAMSIYLILYAFYLSLKGKDGFKVVSDFIRVAAIVQQHINDRLVAPAVIVFTLQCPMESRVSIFVLHVNVHPNFEQCHHRFVRLVADCVIQRRVSSIVFDLEVANLKVVFLK
jgi:hypothetical protein